MIRNLLPSLIFCMVALQAQDHSPKAFLKDLAHEEWRIWTSPARMTKRDFATKAVPMIAGTAILLAADTRMMRGLPNSQTQLDFGRRFSRIGGMYALSGLTLGTFAAGKGTHHASAESMGWDSVKSLLHAQAVVSVIKFAAGRERPVTSFEGRFFKGKDSFPSGHAISSFAVATAIARNKSCPRWLKVASYSAAGLVSFSRVAANRHFASDVFLGSFMGVLIGDYVSSRRR